MTGQPSRRLRVGLHVGQLAQPIPGGIGRVTEMLCAELPRHADVVAFASCPPYRRGRIRARVNGVAEFRGLGVLPPQWCYEVWQRRRRRIDLGVDVCHAPSLAIPPTRAPLVVTVNDVAFIRHPEMFTAHGARFHERALAIARREAAAIIVPSAFTLTELVHEGFEPARIHHVPLTASAPLGCGSRDAEQHLRSLGVREPFLLAVGTVEPRKNYETIVAVLAHVRGRIPEVSLVVAGNPGWNATPAASGLEAAGVVFVGPVRDDELDFLYRRAKIVLNASIYEGFGLTVLEAMARGCAVVASDIPAHGEVGGGGVRLVPARDVDAWADVICRLLVDRGARARLGRLARERSGRFTLARTVAGHLTAYNSVVPGDPPLPC